MRRMIIVPVLLALLLSACGASAANKTGASRGGSLPEMTQLLIGTMKLDGTANEVTKDQAAELVTLWGVYGQLINSDTAAQAEIDGLSKQITETMTADQRKAIAAMKLTQQDMFAFMQEQGGGTAAAGSSPRQGSSGSSGQSSGRGQGGFQGGGPGGGMPPGGMPDMGGGMPGGPTTAQTPSATQKARGAAMNRIPSGLLNALIQYLQKKAGG
jgi:hypothetical protein